MAARTTKRPESCGEDGGGVRRIISIHATAAPGVNTDIPFLVHDGTSATTFKVGGSAGALRIDVCLTTGSILNLKITDGTTAYTQKLNGGVALTAGVRYGWTLAVARYFDNNSATELTYSFQVATDSIIQTLIVDEVAGPVL